METAQQTTETAHLEHKVDLLTEQVRYLVERQRWQADLVDEMMPIARLAMNVGADRLHELDQAGYFRIGREVVRVLERVAESYSEDDVKQLGNHIVGIMDTVKNITQPAILSVANEATEVLHNADEVEPLGVMGMMRASRDEDVQKGMAIMFEVLRQVGRTVSATSTEDHGQRNPPRYAAASAAPVTEDVPPTEDAKPGKAAEPKRCGVPTDAPIAGSAWNHEVGAARAAELGIEEMTAEHWTIIDFARADHAEHGLAPNIRRITQQTGVGTRDLYRLFPKAPARTVAQIAGIPKPAGCI